MSPPVLLVPPALVQSVMEEIFRTMYFLEPIYRGQGHVQAPARGSAVGFSGAATGEFRVVVSEDLARRMTTDFLALDDDEVSQERIEEMVQELANVACGAVMGASMPVADFHSSVPRKLRSGGEAAEFEHCFSVSGEEPEFALDIVFDPTPDA
jgi:hypothetical protein